MNEFDQCGSQSGPETAPLVAISAGYCHFLSPIQARSKTCIDISKKVLYQKSFHFTYKLLIFNKIEILLNLVLVLCSLSWSGLYPADHRS